MARLFQKRDTSRVLEAADQWIRGCLVNDGSVFVNEPRWTAPILDEVYSAFVLHPDCGDDDFMTKLKGQMRQSSASAQQLMAELLWALLLFQSRMKAATKRQQVREIWSLSGHQIPIDHAALTDDALMGIGSGGPGFNNYRPEEMEYLISLVRDLKRKNESQRQRILSDYDEFFNWIESVPRKGSRQFRHMLRYFAFPDRVERISSNNDRRSILKGFGVGTSKEIAEWEDRQLDDKLRELRLKLQAENASSVLDFYETPLKEKWSRDQTIKTTEGEVPVTIPSDTEELEEKHASLSTPPEVRQSIQMQAKLARVGAIMGFRIWIPRSDKVRVSELLQQREQSALLQDLPLNYDNTTLYTIELIDVLWLKGRSIVRAFEVEQTTAVYSGLLRMADLLALQPNMDIRLHIVAPDERRDKVFNEMRRPVFSVLERGPLSKRATFLSYESVNAMSSLEYLAHTNDSVIAEYEEQAE